MSTHKPNSKARPSDCQQPTMRVVVESKPLPPDILDRFALLYKLAELRYREKMARLQQESAA